MISRKAFALSMTLWVVAALMSGMTILLLFAKDSVRLSGALEDKLQTQIKVEEVFELLKFYATTASHSYHVLHNDNMPALTYDFPVDLVADDRLYDIGRGCSIRVMDTSGLVNVMMASPGFISSIATTPRQRQLGFVLRDSLADWKDPDDIVRLNGAESSTYKIKWQREYGARNSQGIQDINELRLIRGFDSLDAERWERLENKLYFGGPGRINLLLVDEEYLGFLLDISRSYTQTLAQLRREDIGAFIRSVQNLKNFNEDLYGFSISRQLRIEIIAQEKEARSILKAIVRFMPDRNGLTTTYFMRID